MAYIDDTEWAIRETVKKLGSPPLIGSFEPKFSDIGRNDQDEYWSWTGVSWVPCPSGIERLIRKALASI